MAKGKTKKTMKTPPTVSPKEWEAAREELLVKEKELTRARDALAAQRRRMPWLAVEKEYEFDAPDGKASLLDLFEGRRQLVVYRFFYGPDITTYARPGDSYPERACVTVTRQGRMQPRVLLDGLGIPESPRWHEGRLWFSNWGTGQIVAVDLDGNGEVVGEGPDGLGWATNWLPDGSLLVTGQELV